MDSRNGRAPGAIRDFFDELTNEIGRDHGRIGQHVCHWRTVVQKRHHHHRQSNRLRGGRDLWKSLGDPSGKLRGAIRCSETPTPWAWAKGTSIARSQETPPIPGLNNNSICARGVFSYHPGGSQFGLVDGSVHFISQNIDWRPDIEVNSVYEYWGAMADGNGSVDQDFGTVVGRFPIAGICTDARMRRREHERCPRLGHRHARRRSPQVGFRHLSA